MKTLKQQLQEKLPFPDSPCTWSIDDFIKIFGEWLEQKRQELNAFPNVKKEAIIFCNELLEELKE